MYAYNMHVMYEHLRMSKVSAYRKSENSPRNAGFSNKVKVIIISLPFGCHIRK